MNNNFSYRPDIDGLRALAVLAVIANHLPEKFLASGFLGVDVFFVISGFVVTASILRQGSASLGGFYLGFLARRVKRLWPALIACTSVTALVTWMVIPQPQQFLLTGFAALFGASNLALIHFGLDYFATGTRLNPFTHTWSLGVEEQFYLLYPALVWLFYLRAGSWRHRTLPIALLTASALALYFFYTLYDSQRLLGYYLMPTRFWELGVGALAYLLSTSARGESVLWVARLVNVPALCGLLVTFAVPAQYAATSTVAAVIFTAIVVMQPVKLFSVSLLAASPFVYIGRISYSLYLWHWPVVVLAPFVLADAWHSSALYVLSMFALAALSYHTLENPLRRARWSSSNARDVGIALGLSVCIGTLVYAVHNVRNPSVFRFPPNTQAVYPGGPPFQSTCVIHRGQVDFDMRNFDKCTVPPRAGSGQPTVWAEGDSHAGHLHTMLLELHKATGAGFHVIEAHARAFPGPYEKEYAPREKIHRAIVERLEPGDILLIARNYMTTRPFLRPFDDIDEWIERVDALAETLYARGVATVVVGPLPRFGFEDRRQCLASQLACREPRQDHAAIILPIQAKLEALQAGNKGIHLFDLFSALCPPGDDYCEVRIAGDFIYRDAHHLNTVGAAAMMEPFREFLLRENLLAE